MAKNSSTGRNVNAPQDSLIIAPPSRTKWERVKIFIWNGETKEFLGRTAGSWVQIQLFYVALYAFLAAFFAAMLVVFFQTVDSEAPKWQNDNGLIGSNPGLGFRPKPSKDDEDSATIQFTNDADGNWKYYSSELKNFLGSYSSTNNSVNCSFNNLPPEDAVCNFDTKLLGPQCTEKNNFGYASGQPCIIIKLNRIYGWIPKTYDDPAQLPEDMPDDLKEYIKTKANKNSNQLNMIWLSCDGESSPDKENIGNLTYTPYRGFPAFYYPYKHIPGYLSPIVAVQFKNPKVGVRIKIECKAWAENIFRNRQRSLGSVSFELFLE